ncbi:MAG TPA: asparagine synthetase B family protein [Phycisphaerales bacterium]|nr:asparagine synthetase B family protein [Phycisphaerales bacterium]
MINEVIDLTDHSRNMIFNMEIDQATEIVATGDPEKIATIKGHFAIMARHNHIIRMARTLQLPMRYFIVKKVAGPALLLAERIDQIKTWLEENGFGDQFHPSYTRMVPAHHLTEIALVGCPDPNPVCTRFFNPEPNSTKGNIGASYIGELANTITQWLHQIPEHEPIGVLFSGGIDSGAVFLTTYNIMKTEGMNLARLKAFTLSVNGEGQDAIQARNFMSSLDLELFHEVITTPESWVNLQEAVQTIEDYKPLDIQSGAMTLALCRGIREQYPDFTYLIDGDGGDENLKDYPIEENPELTIKSVLSNQMLYQEGWGVDAIKHSLTFSGGLSRACTRGYAPMQKYNFRGFSPFMLPSVIEVAEGIPYIELTDWNHEKLYALKGEIVSKGIESLTGMHMPIFEKRRFQDGASKERAFGNAPMPYRKAFHATFDC